MKKKIALFLFALGLGSSAAYAYPSVAQCRAQCDYDYRACVAAGNSGCIGERSACWGDCVRM